MLYYLFVFYHGVLVNNSNPSLAIVILNFPKLAGCRGFPHILHGHLYFTSSY
uniref:Uncharacterized protein n=1 Tax=Rhizophora mucronata TaxID=61149 RepID=A0A2P2NYR7_RHIMU